ncbi:MAG: hypothetical protein ACMUEM_04795 [Flavobacteriales bacterium AspAUS03]
MNQEPLCHKTLNFRYIPKSIYAERNKSDQFYSQLKGIVFSIDRPSPSSRTGHKTHIASTDKPYPITTDHYIEHDSQDLKISILD